MTPSQILVESRRKALADARSLVELARTEKRAMTDEEDANYGKFIDESNSLDKRIELEVRAEKLDRRDAELAAADKATEDGKNRGKPDEKGERRAKVFRKWLTHGEKAAEQEAAKRTLELLRAQATGQAYEG